MHNKKVQLRLNDVTAQIQLIRLINETPGLVLENSIEIECDLLIFEITKENSDEQFDIIKAITNSNYAPQVFLVSHLFDPNLLVQALRIGTKEFFQLPLNLEEVKNALLKFQSTAHTFNMQQAAPEGEEGTIIHIIGSKGGVGTTTIAVNLAANLVASDRKPTVALVDMNLLFGEVPIFLGIKSFDFDWAEVAQNIDRLDKSFLTGVLYKHPSGIQVLPSPTSIFKKFTFGPDIVTKLFRIMKTMFDYVIIDGGQGIGEMSTALLKLADKIFIVTLLNVPCLINVKRLKDTFDELGLSFDERVNIVANRAQTRSAGEIPLEDAERTLNKKIQWAVPNDFKSTMVSINMGKSLREVAPSSEINIKIMEMAESLQGGRPQESKKTGFFERLFSK